MARYCYSYVLDGECICYLESTAEEDGLDSIDNEICMHLTGQGYLEFWVRCKRALCALPKGGTSTITDTYTGDEKVW